MAANYVIWFENLRMTDVESVGGKNASLGEMISQLTEKGVRVPGGFATTAEAYRAFLAHNGWPNVFPQRWPLWMWKMLSSWHAWAKKSANGF